MIGIGCTIGLGCLTIALWYVAHEGRALTREGQAFADASLRAITSHWNLDEARLRATPRLRRSLTADRLESVFAWFSSLGPLVSSKGCTGEAAAFAALNGRNTILARYVCPATYQDGDATVTMQLVKDHGEWLINGFDVTSDHLLNSQPSERI